VKGAEEKWPAEAATNRRLLLFPPLGRDEEKKTHLFNTWSTSHVSEAAVKSREDVSKRLSASLSREDGHTH